MCLTLLNSVKQLNTAKAAGSQSVSQHEGCMKLWAAAPCDLYAAGTAELQRKEGVTLRFLNFTVASVWVVFTQIDWQSKALYEGLLFNFESWQKKSFFRAFVVVVFFHRMCLQHDDIDWKQAWCNCDWFAGKKKKTQTCKNGWLMDSSKLLSSFLSDLCRLCWCLSTNPAFFFSFFWKFFSAQRKKQQMRLWKRSK